ncbi:conserved membrane hypothetical protein [Candidatus Roizmanbacteria bacterium]|nr:conserved membrane hypothetical protein [Candidatus Roizmanbacteria bacterium]
MVKRKHSLLSKKIDIVFLILSPIFASVTSLYFRTNFLTSTLLFYGIPAVYLSLRNMHAVKKSAIFSFIFGLIGGGIIFDYLSHFNNLWFVPSIFPIRILGQVPIEDLLWGFLSVYNIIMFYEHLLDKGKHNLKNTHMKYFITIIIFCLTIFLVIYIFKNELFLISYFYAKIILVLFLIPTISFLTFFPRLLSKYLKTGVYFFAQSLMFELTALSLNQWSFNGNQYIGWVQILGKRFPLEEFIFWMILLSTCVLSYYEFFDDDRK